jgi:uncharacterized membrane protein YhaH (DUF805 family)
MQKYFSFSDTATRSEYWAVQLISLVVVAILMTVAGLTAISVPALGLALILALGIAYVWLLVATSVRRCRDADLSPWWTLALLLPYAGFVVWIVIGCLKTHEQQKTNPVLQP